MTHCLGLGFPTGPNNPSFSVVAECSLQVNSNRCQRWGKRTGIAIDGEERRAGITVIVSVARREGEVGGDGADEEERKELLQVFLLSKERNVGGGVDYEERKGKMLSGRHPGSVRVCLITQDVIEALQRRLKPMF
ncbi:hypothetical protein SADUNF_Sadunf15G0112500 [Salix dunnii]|uniref:Uncharacterized protein n=1 Tax=Salix dunnii TaxID=1413687 RepID=A0A835JD33_9ROSI|nr:hypothetical protein SADUNF_Sadunf15G0112500 [Salix dunnii]